MFTTLLYDPRFRRLAWLGLTLIIFVLAGCNTGGNDTGGAGSSDGGY
jgi:hypothetical protein